MIKKAVLTALFLLGALGLYAQEKEIIPWRENITMLVVPREPVAIQLAQDISRRYPALIVCYQQTPDEPALHAWNGAEWLEITVENYTNGTFFTTRPRHTVIVEKEGRPAPDVLVPDGTWCEKGDRLTSTDPRVMIHLLGRHFDFPYRYWVQFSKRYNYALEEINPALINVLFWHYQADEAIAAFKARDFDRDMDQWIPLDIVLPEPIEPVELQVDPDIILPAEVPVAEVTDEPADMPEDAAVESEEEPVTDAEVVAPEDVVTSEEAVEPAKSAEETVIEIMAEIAEAEAVAEVEVEEAASATFSTNDVPAAEIIMTPAE